MNTLKPCARPTVRQEPAAISRRVALALAAAALLLPSLSACANGSGEARARWQPVEMAIVDRSTALPLAQHRKDGAVYVAGQPAARYAIRLRNHTSVRVLVVLSVDGVNVVSGETAAYGQTGYVLDAWQSADITGWRKSDTAVAAFEFAALSESYAARTGRPGNVGVIGAAVFLEKPAAPPPPVLQSAPWSGADAARDSHEPRRRVESAAAASPEAPSPTLGSSGKASADSAARASAPAPLAQGTERLGTAHGQREWSASARTRFERRSTNPQQLIEIAYDSHANLVAAGVIARPLAQARAFPQEPAQGFVPDPSTR